MKFVSLIFKEEQYLVSRDYIAPVGIGEAFKTARDGGYSLPSPEMVDAIWEAADLKVAPLPRKTNGTFQQMATKVVFDDQERKIREQINGRDYNLIAGNYKDVAIKNGVIGLYGWHRPDGSVIQPFTDKHGPFYFDYSQGLRLVRKC